MTEPLEKDIQEILLNFDWPRVQATMSALEWRWVGVEFPPSERELKSKARELLQIAINTVSYSRNKEDTHTVSTGGLEAKAQKFKDTGKIFLSLKFVVTSWGNYE